MPNTILIVDDDVDIVEFIAMGLEVEGFTPLKAFNGKEAFKILEDNIPDLILLDIMMPDISGYEVCKELKMQRKFNLIPIIMLTAKLKESDKYEGFITGADEYITKPFDFDLLVSSIKRIIAENIELKEKKGLKEKFNFTLFSKFEYLRQVNELITKLFINTGLQSSEIFKLKLALHELGVNAIEHGNLDNEQKTVTIYYTLFKEKLKIEIIDEGEGFEWNKLKNPVESENIERDRGRGIFMVKNFMDEVEFIEPGNHVVMTKLLSPSSLPSN
ncbi:MAG: ATP-binding protein [bacterium]|nr:ATP-binding protein [bacterium]